MARKNMLTSVSLLFGALLSLLYLARLAVAEPNAVVLERLPYTFDFDGPAQDEPNLVFVGSWPETPKKMMVYSVNEPNVTEAFVRKLALEYFGIGAGAALSRSRRLGLYRFRTDTEYLQVNPANGTFSLRKIRKGIPPAEIMKSYPLRQECKTIAEQYLTRRDLLPKEAYFRGVVDNTRGADVMSIGFGRKVNGYKTWGAGGGIGVHIGCGGDIIAIRKAWQDLSPYKMYPIKTPQQSLEELCNGKGVLMHGSKGRVENIEVRYYTSPEKQEYVQPIYYFDCNSADGAFYGVVSAIQEQYLKSREETLKELKEKREGTVRK